MLCQRCKKNAATENYVEIINGEKFESHLCAKCSSELYGELHSKMSENVCAWLFGSSAPKKVCPVCGTTYADYERSGLLGCASCYDVFKEELLPAIKAIQGKVEHVGKVETNNDDLGLHRRLKSLSAKAYAAKFHINKRIYEINKILYGGEND